MASIIHRRAQVSLFLNSTDEEWVSRASARREALQDATLDLLAKEGINGVTWRDIARQIGGHHGLGTAILESLCAERRVVRVKGGAREAATVYVLPRFESESAGSR